MDNEGSTWTNSSDLNVGYNGNGIMKIINGGTVNNFNGYISRYPNSFSTANVDGNNSKWINTSNLYIGNAGNGELKITNGGTVRSYGGTIGYSSISVGTVTVDGTNSNWTNDWVLRVGGSGKGTLNITDGGAVIDNICYIGGDSGSTGFVTVSGPGSMLTNSSNLDVGYSGKGILNIANGAIVNQLGSAYNYIAYSSGSVGTVTVDGTNSKWTNNGLLYVGCSGNGTLKISNGGTVSSDQGYLSGYSGSVSIVTVDGKNSNWDNNGGLYVGYWGKGTLEITGGGAVKASSVSINSQSLLAIDVGNGSLLTVNNGSGAISNSGTVRILAGANVAASSTYTPISASTWSGTGTYQPIGGTWNTTDHTFTASFAQADFSGMPITINLKNTQRVSVYLNSTQYGPGDCDLGVSFAPTATDTLLDFNATPIGGQPLLDLQSILNANQQTFLSDWQVTATGGYTTGNPAYLSFNVGTGISRNNIRVWHYDGAA